MHERSTASTICRPTSPEEARLPDWVNAFALAIWLLAGVIPFIPLAWDASPWLAVTLRLSENEGDWWHLFMGLPFFLAYPMIWLRFRGLFFRQPSTRMERRVIWGAVACSVACTILVHVPFLLHIVGTSKWQTLAIPSLIFGLLACGVLGALLLQHRISPTRECLVGLDAAYLANSALCLIMFREPSGIHWGRAGWLISAVIFWPILSELIWLLVQALRVSRRNSIVEPAKELASC